ncbi:MAG: phosphate ABC transporter permease subunit PstC [Gammaproteobacteria bacterium]|jgi:phosphate transport system permease protein|nr:phosphate ABC transporter permease subunit PstC [Gammaproteobacteria bacterium]
MQPSTLIPILLILSAAGYYLGRKRALRVGSEQAGGVRRLHSLPSYHGYLLAIWAALPALIVLSVWLAIAPKIITHLVVAGLSQDIQNLPPERLGLVMNDVRNLVEGNIVSGEIDETMKNAAAHYTRLQQTGNAVIAAIALALSAGGILLGWKMVSPRLRARRYVEKVITFVLITCSTIAIFTTLGIVLSLLFEAMRFFRAIPITDFLFGLEWSPQTAIRADQVGASGAFGTVPLFAGTMLISLIAMLVAVPIGLLSAIYLSEYASGHVRAVVKPVLEILAGVPTVVYGFFAALTVAPTVRIIGESIGLTVSSESALAAGLVMGVMIIPFVSSLSDDVINAVPQAMRDGSLALGATQSETIRRVIFPAALPGIVGGILLALSRAIGETMIVVMAAGLSANLTANPLEAVTTVTVQIVTLLTGDQEFDSPKTLAAFALGLLLFTMTLILNVIALHVVRKYREQYE